MVDGEAGEIVRLDNYNLRPARLPYVPEFSPERLELRERVERQRKEKAEKVDGYLNNKPKVLTPMIESIFVLSVLLIGAVVAVVLFPLTITIGVLWFLYYEFSEIPRRKTAYMKAYYAGKDPDPREYGLDHKEMMSGEEMDFWRRRYMEDVAKGLDPDPCRYYLPSRNQSNQGQLNDSAERSSLT